MRGMTAYARVERRSKDLYLDIIIRSTNSKYLEVITHLPLENLFLEEPIKKEVQKELARGRVEVHVFVRAKPRQHLVIDDGLLFQYFRKIKQISRQVGVSCSPSVESLLMLPGVINLQTESGGDSRLILSAFKECLKKLIQFKKKSGAAIRREIIKNVNRIAVKLKNIERIKPAVDSTTEKDIDEEITLLKFYLTRLRRLVSVRRDTPVGKQLDFLTQEILRELNAAASKTKKKKISWWLVETKAYLERIREQVQNVE